MQTKPWSISMNIRSMWLWGIVGVSLLVLAYFSHAETNRTAAVLERAVDPGAVTNRPGVLLVRTRMSADKGDVRAMLFLGSLYDRGEGVAQDYAEAVKWYSKAADAGDTDAMSALGTMCEHGEGVATNYAQAYMWYSLSVAAGGKDAVELRDRLRSLMTLEQIAAGQKAADEWKPAVTNKVRQPSSPGR
ncbi:MAG: hypothetical protein C0404_04545 [Verrucomicrobia bacterium]|nr:hypothetical protein [Verrucomicrobiota bacterium]